MVSPSSCMKDLMSAECYHNRALPSINSSAGGSSFSLSWTSATSGRVCLPFYFDIVCFWIIPTEHIYQAEPQHLSYPPTRFLRFLIRMQTHISTTNHRTSFRILVYCGVLRKKCRKVQPTKNPPLPDPRVRRETYWRSWTMRVFRGSFDGACFSKHCFETNLIQWANTELLLEYSLPRQRFHVTLPLNWIPNRLSTDKNVPCVPFVQQR